MRRALLVLVAAPALAGCAADPALAASLANATRPSRLPKVVACWEKEFEAGGFSVERSETVLRPANTIELDADGLGKIVRLIDALEELDDVQKVSANFEADEAAMEAVFGG